MPALDTRGRKFGSLHIMDQNKLKPEKTLCGQALDKESVQYWTAPENFEKADCKVCRSIYFNETWSGESRDAGDANQQEETSEPTIIQTPAKTFAENEAAAALAPQSRTLFGNLSVPVNEHPKKDEANG